VRDRPDEQLHPEVTPGDGDVRDVAFVRSRPGADNGARRMFMLCFLWIAR
jgi:hypothetical protein